MSVIIYDTCPTFKAIFSDGYIITDTMMSFKNLLDYIDKIKIDKSTVIIYNRFMELNYL